MGRTVERPGGIDDFTIAVYESAIRFGRGRIVRQLVEQDFRTQKTWRRPIRGGERSRTILSRQRSRVRVSSSPPFISKELGGVCGNHRGREKDALRALFVPFFCVATFRRKMADSE
jgi:hypothetical protein